MKSRPLIERYLEKVLVLGDDDCWPWIAYKNAGGYGVIGVGKKTKLAHIVSYEVNVGPVLLGKEVAHRCDNPSCQNPRHLFLVTHKENMHDCMNKGRYRFVCWGRGENSASSKLSNQIVAEMISLHNQGLSFANIGCLFEVCASTAHRAVTGRTWSHLVDRDGEAVLV